MAASFSSHRNTDKHARKIRKNPQSSEEKNDLYPPYCKHRNYPITLREWESVQRRTSLEGRTGSWYEKLLSFCAVCGWVLRGSGAAVRMWRELESRRWRPGTASVEGLALHNTLLLRSPSATTSPLSLRSLTHCALPSATVSRVLSAHSLNALSLVSTSRFRNKSKLDLDTNLGTEVHTCTSYENSKTLSLSLCCNVLHQVLVLLISLNSASCKTPSLRQMQTFLPSKLVKRRDAAFEKTEAEAENRNVNPERIQSSAIKQTIADQSSLLLSAIPNQWQQLQPGANQGDPTLIQTCK